MKSKNRLVLIVLTIMAMVACLIGAVACGGGDAEAIDMYLLPQNQQLVDEDFSLPKYIGQDNAVEVKWESSNTNAISIVDNGDSYTAKVTLQDEVTEVTLTISAGKATKDFTVRVDGFSVYTFVDHFTFEQFKKSVSNDFDLKTSFEYLGRTATIVWAIDAEYNEYITLNESGNKVHVVPAEGIKEVKIKATFTYKEETATATYQFSVAPALEHRQAVSKIYSVEGYPLELSGYIVHVFEASESYGNATFYMIDDDFCSGYYCFRVKIDKTKVAQFVDGAHVTVSGDTTKNYSGLWENNSGGTATVDENVDPINPREKVYAADLDIIAKTPSILWRESTFVSLTGWKVSAVGTKPSSWSTGSKGTEGNIVTLTRGDTSIAVYLNKYMGRTQEQLEAFGSLYDNLQVGQFVNITGILGCHKNEGQADLDGLQILPVLASDITKVDAEGSTPDGVKVKAAVAQVAEKAAANFGAITTSAQTYDMPTSVEGVAISYRVAGIDLKDVTVSIKGGKFTVNPIDSEKNYDIEVTYKIGDYEGYSFFNVRNWKMSDDKIVEQVKANIEKLAIDDVTKTGAVTIPEFDALGTTVTWAVKSGAPEWLTVENNVVTVNTLPAADTDVTIVATIKAGDATETAELTFKVQKAPDKVFQAIDAPAAGDYIFALYQGTLDKWLYANGEISTNSSGDFGATTDNAEEAATFALAASGEGWTIQLKSDGKYLELNDNHRWTYSETSTMVWMWNTEAKVFTLTLSDKKTYYLGTYDTYETISASTVDRITGSNLNSPTQYVAKFGKIVSTSDITDDSKAQQTVDGLALSRTSFSVLNEEITLPTEPNNFNAKIEWKVSGDTDLVTITGTTLKIVKLPAASTEVTLEVSATVGSTTKKATVKITVNPAVTASHAGTQTDPYSVADALALAGTIGEKNSEYYKVNGEPVKVYIKGYVTNVGEISYKDSAKTDSYGLKNVLIADTKGGTTTIKLSSVNWDDTIMPKQDTNPLTVGDEVVVWGYINWYNGAAVYYYNKDNAYFTSWTKDSTGGGSTGGDQPSPSGFTPLTTPQAGSYYMAMQVDSEYWYITGKMAATYYFGTVKDVSSAVQVTLVASGDNWLIKYGEKFIEISLNGTHINAVYSDTQSGTWSWNATEGVFVWNKNGTDYIIGNTGTFTNIGGIALSDKAANHFAVLGTYNGTTGGTTPGGSTGGEGGGTNPQPGETEEGLIYTLTTTTRGDGDGYNAYNTATSVDVNGITWEVMGNTSIGTGQYDISEWHFGGKNTTCANADRTITGRDAITGTVKRVVVALGKTSGSIDVNSIQLKVYSSDPGVEGATLVATKDITWSENGTVTITADGDGWTDCYFVLVMNLNVSGTQNKWIAIDSIKFYSTTASTAAATATAMLPGKQLNA